MRCFQKAIVWSSELFDMDALHSSTEELERRRDIALGELR